MEKHTHGLYIRNRILFVKVDSAALRQELSFSRSKIVKALNDEAKANQKSIDDNYNKAVANGDNFFNAKNI